MYQACLLRLQTFGGILRGIWHSSYPRHANLLYGTAFVAGSAFFIGVRIGVGVTAVQASLLLAGLAIMVGVTAAYCPQKRTRIAGPDRANGQSQQRESAEWAEKHDAAL